MYKIVFTYTTGNSFCEETRDSGFDEQWHSLEEATQALERMRGHYIWQRKKERSYKPIPPPGWWKSNPESKDSEWYFNTTLNGYDHWIYAYRYLGYFDELLSARIDGPGLSFTVEDYD